MNTLLKVSAATRVALMSSGALLLTISCSNPPEEPEVITAETATCTRDEVEGEANAETITSGSAAQGYICPVEDVDWYRYDVPSGHSIMRLDLKMGAALSPIEPNYSIWTANGTERGKLLAQPVTTRVGQSFSESHCVEPGPTLIKVHDLGDDTQDVRYTYTLEVSSREDLDKQEPNEATETAYALSNGDRITAAISCQGDQDWYKFTLPADTLLKLSFTSDVAGYEPALRILDAEQMQLVEEINMGGSVRPTEFERFEVLQGAGDYFILIADDDDEHANPDVPYTLAIDFVSDRDGNEPNNTPAQATPIVNTPLDCQGATSEVTFQGTIGAASDQDWFALPLAQNCQGKILDASVEVNTSNLNSTEQWELQSDFQIALSMVRGHKESACSQDNDCGALQLPCSSDFDCAGYYETCLPEGLCAGASTCLPESICGANQVIRRYECNPRLAECKPQSGVSPPEMRARLSAPIFDTEVIYLKVNDFQSDKAAPEQLYTLRVKTRPDTDTAEPSNLFLNALPQEDLSGRPHRQFARDIPVHDCTTGDCCNGGTWVDGSLAYENDLDWFRYPHPCPGEDCTMRMHYEVDSGPVDFVINLYRNNDLWFTAFDNEELDNQSAKQGTMGGLTANDRCFYAYQGHTPGNNSDTFYYYVVVRDLLDLYEDGNVAQRIPIPDSRDWAPNQRYRICVEKIANLCSEPPCQLYDDGCGQPQ